MKEKKEIFGSDSINVQLDLSELNIIYDLLKERANALDAIIDFSEQRGIRYSLFHVRKEFIAVRELFDKIEKYNLPL